MTRWTDRKPKKLNKQGLQFYILESKRLDRPSNGTYNFYVLVLNNSSYQKLSDLNNKTMGYYEIDNVDSNEYLNKIDKKIDISFAKNDNYSDLTNNLLNNKVDSIVIKIQDQYINSQ